MAINSLNEAIALYQGGALTLEEAADRVGISSNTMKSKLRSHGVTVREEATKK
jgi:predicted HTH domain antitoxin